VVALCIFSFLPCDITESKTVEKGKTGKQGHAKEERDLLCAPADNGRWEMEGEEGGRGVQR
jgi:hypothetical protein